ncbi:hypothetical protein GW17_00056309 [Ensete ventricosum]|nr:hypothetical protein GW17_00056309 [Ensete ventricosum]
MVHTNPIEDQYGRYILIYQYTPSYYVNSTTLAKGSGHNQLPKRAGPELHKIEEKEGQADLTLTADAGRRGEDNEGDKEEGERKKRQGRQTKMKRRRRKRNMRMKTPARPAAISDLIDDTVVGLVALVAVVIVSIPIDHSSPENKRGGEKGALNLWHPPFSARRSARIDRSPPPAPTCLSSSFGYYSFARGRALRMPAVIPL